MGTIDIVTVVCDAATMESAVAYMRALEATARRRPHSGDVRVLHFASEDVPSGYVRIFWGDVGAFVEARPLPYVAGQR